MFHQFQSNIESLKINLKKQITNENSSYYPIQCIDTSNSATKGWMVFYAARPTKNNKLFDAKQTIMSAFVYQFESFRKLIMKYDQMFSNEKNKETMFGEAYKKYENDEFSFACYQKDNSNLIKVTVLDPSSPFYMLSLRFTVTNSKKDKDDQNNPLRIVIGENQPFILHDNYFKITEAAFAPEKTPFISRDRNETKYIVNIKNRYQALAYIVESFLFEKAMDEATKQWIASGQADQYSNTKNTPSNDFMSTVSAQSQHVLSQLEESLIF